MSDTLPPGGVTGKRLETASAAEYAEMQVNRACIAEAIRAFKLYFKRLRVGEADSEDERTIRVALFRDGINQLMACFTKNLAKRDRYLIPSEAFAGIEGWEEYYAWIHALRDGFAAHNFGAKRNSEPIVLVHPETLNVLGVGHLTVTYVGEGIEAEESIATFCNAALRNVNGRIEELHQNLQREAEALSPDELASLMNARNVVPGPDDTKTGRVKYRNKTKAAQQQGEG